MCEDYHSGVLTSNIAKYYETLKPTQVRTQITLRGKILRCLFDYRNYLGSVLKSLSSLNMCNTPVKNTFDTITDIYDREKLTWLA